jgi:hypothetical protein
MELPFDDGFKEGGKDAWAREEEGGSVRDKRARVRVRVQRWHRGLVFVRREGRGSERVIIVALSGRRVLQVNKPQRGEGDIPFR